MAPWFMDSKIVLRFMNMQWRCDILLLRSKTAKVLYMYMQWRYDAMVYGYETYDDGICYGAMVYRPEKIANV